MEISFNVCRNALFRARQVWNLSGGKDGACRREHTALSGLTSCFLRNVRSACKNLGKLSFHAGFAVRYIGAVSCSHNFFAQVAGFASGNFVPDNGYTRYADEPPAFCGDSKCRDKCDDACHAKSANCRSLFFCNAPHDSGKDNNKAHSSAGTSVRPDK